MKNTKPKRATRKAATKKRRSNKAPTAKQLAARRKFAMAAKARAKAKKKHGNPADYLIAKYYVGRGWKWGVPSKLKPGEWSFSSKIYKSREAAIRAGKRETGLKPRKFLQKRTPNKTIISKPKRVIVLNPGAMVRRKVRNSFVSLRVHGQAKKTPTGWKLGNKTFPQGTGIVPATRKGFYLDRATGTVFSKVARNAEKRDADHPIEVTRHWRQGPPGYLTPWQRAHHAGQKQLFDTGIKPAKKRNSAKKKIGQVWIETRGTAQGHNRYVVLVQSASGRIEEMYDSKDKSRAQWEAKTLRQKIAKRTYDVLYLLSQPNSAKSKVSPKVRQLRETFTGTASRKTATMNASEGTPANLAKLGKLILIKTQRGTIKPGSGTTWLCADAKGKLHLTTTAARLIDGPAQNFGEVSQIEYEATKPHLGHTRPTIFFHKMGEEGGKRPVLIADGKGGLKLRGGSYRIEREGIVD